MITHHVFYYFVVKKPVAGISLKNSIKATNCTLLLFQFKGGIKGKRMSCCSAKLVCRAGGRLRLKKGLRDDNSLTCKFQKKNVATKVVSL